jgi:hypothetical protein
MGDPFPVAAGKPFNPKSIVMLAPQGVIARANSGRAGGNALTYNLAGLIGAATGWLLGTGRPFHRPSRAKWPSCARDFTPWAGAIKALSLNDRQQCP